MLSVAKLQKCPKHMRVSDQQVIVVWGQLCRFHRLWERGGQNEGKKAEKARYQLKRPPSPPTDVRVQGPTRVSRAQGLPSGSPSYCLTCCLNLGSQGSDSAWGGADKGQRRSRRWRVTCYLNGKIIPSVQFSSVTQSCLTLCDPMDRSTPGLPVHHQLLEFTQTHVHLVSDAIQPSHPLSSPFPPAPSPSQHQSLFQ